MLLFVVLMDNERLFVGVSNDLNNSNLQELFPISFEDAVYELGLLLVDTMWCNSNGLL